MAKQIDARSARFGAVVTSVVLASALAFGETSAMVGLLVLQFAAFGIGAIVGPQAQPYGRLFARFIAPRLTSTATLEPSAPPRFAQAVGLAFVAVSLLGVVAGSAAVTSLAVGFALAAALLNAAFGICLGCELYLVGLRLAAAK